MNQTYALFVHAARWSLQVISVLVIFYNMTRVVCQSPVPKGWVKRWAQVMGDAEKQLPGFKSDRTNKLGEKIKIKRSKCPKSLGRSAFLVGYF